MGLPGLTDGALQQAINRGEIVRTHVPRPTKKPPAFQGPPAGKPKSAAIFQ